MRNRICVFVVVFSIASTSWAVTPKAWRVATTEGFLGGEIEGLAVTGRGQLRAAPDVEKISSLNDPFVFSQASDGGATRFLGTGNSGNVYRLRDRKLELLFTAEEPQVHALAWSKGALFVGTSPNGKVYRVDPTSGKATTFFDPKQAYIWAIVPMDDGSLAVATGTEGKLFRVTSSGSGSVWFAAPEAHLRNLVPAGKGRLIAGGSGEGRIYEISSTGGRALFDSPLPEISALYYDVATSTGWAAAASSARPVPPPPKTSSVTQDQSRKESQDRTDAKSSSEGSVEVTISYEEPVTSKSQQGSGELYRIDPDGFVELARRFDREIVYSIAAGSRPDSLTLSTGPGGRIYEVDASEVALVASLPEKQIVSFESASGALYATTTNGGAVYRVMKTLAKRAEYRSVVKDFDRFSRPGAYSVEGSGLDGIGLGMSFRSGNTDSPDDTWSAWSQTSAGSEGHVMAPPARFFQWKLTVDRTTPGFSIDAVTVAYVNRNVAPVVEGLVVNEPGVIFLSGNYPAAPQVVEATNPDENGIFTSLDPSQERGGAGKKYYRKSYRTISWKASDANGDELRYVLSFRPKGSTSWLRLRDNITETQTNFDTSQLPDGIYELRLTASDEKDNPNAKLEAFRAGVEMMVDNTPSTLSVSSNGNDLVIRASDALSAIGRAEYSMNAEKWLRLEPEDGITDQRSETFRLSKNSVDGRFVVVRVVDAQFNVATMTVGAAK